MSRLTYKNYIDEYEVEFEKNSKEQWSIAESDEHIRISGKPINKLAEFEDLMEEHKIGSIEHLKSWLDEQQRVAEYHIKYQEKKRDEIEQLQDARKEVAERIRMFLNEEKDKFKNKKTERVYGYCVCLFNIDRFLDRLVEDNNTK